MSMQKTTQPHAITFQFLEIFFEKKNIFLNPDNLSGTSCLMFSFLRQFLKKTFSDKFITKQLFLDSRSYNFILVVQVAQENESELWNFAVCRFRYFFHISFRVQYKFGWKILIYATDRGNQGDQQESGQKIHCIILRKIIFNQHSLCRCRDFINFFFKPAIIFLRLCSA